MRNCCDAEGGDPPCWAHLLDIGLALGENAAEPGIDVVNLPELAAGATLAGVAWSQVSDDLNVNLAVFGANEGVEPHVNPDVDVLIVIVSGEGTLVVESTHSPIRTGQAVVIPRGARRMLRGSGQGIAYLTCHQRRAGLWPSPRVAHSSASDG